MSNYITRHLKLIGFVIIVVVFALVPLVASSPYYLGILITVGINAVLAVTFILILRTGLVTLAIAGFWGLGAYSSAVLARDLHLSFWACLPTAAIITGVVALIIGIVLIRHPGFSFTIITMVLGALFVVIVGSSSWLGGYVGFRNIPDPSPITLPFLTIDFKNIFASYYLALILILIVVVVLTIMYHRWLGRAWTAIGLNSQLAESLGINVFRYRLIAFVAACTIAGLFGSFYAHYVGVLKPDTFSIFKTVYVQIYALLGGIGYAFMGPIVGSIILVLFPEFMRFTTVYEPIISGLLVILLVIFLPSGLLSLPGLRRLVGEPSINFSGITKMVRRAFSSKQETG